ncbi:uncharacterized protein LOC129608885 [Condylostylus longicornis]|uniref:uncharacterized protein LOC129608885 n=1 Tax=Condylostylus longicornis TaxID=2530218 RepID=UPI00244E02EC|nr:uncharacterized protein LOC129608885 [Condylostylus longicornis]
MSEEIEKLKEAETTVEYSKIVVPKGMRSTYWRYFGFPADDNSQIVTKNKILCVLCNTAIVYNKNTTNLRTHLVAKHPDEFIAIAQEKRREIFADKSESYYVSTVPQVKKMKSEDGEINIQKNRQQKIDIKISSDLITDFTSELDTQDNNYNEEDSVQNYEYESMAVDTNNLNHINPEVQQYNVNDLIQKMLVLDLLSPSIFKGEGFKNLIRCMGGDFDEVKRNEVKQNIEMIYQENLNKKLEIIEQKSSLYPYSISVEFFENFTHPENPLYTNICFIFLDISKISLDNTFYKSLPIQEITDFEEIFYGIDLKNCVAVVVNQNNTQLQQFVKTNAVNAQIVLCIDAILQNCIKHVFNLQDVQEIFDEALRIYEKVISDYEPELYIGMDEICIWYKIYLLQRFTDTVSLKNDENNVMQKIDEILYCLNPLKITLETIADEHITSCTLVQPLISKLIDFNYCIEERDSEMTKQIKLIIVKELTESVIENVFLTESAFIDPRFHSYIDSEARKMVKSNLLLKYDSEIEIKKEMAELKVDQNKGNSSNNSAKRQKRSSLKLFFNQTEEKNKITTLTKNGLESELIKYDSETNVDLDQCPITWWLDTSYSFKNLSKISQNYFTVPCSVNNLFKKSIEERIDIYNRRRKLTYKYFNQLWFLYINNIETEFTKF